jgi:hypothetical protein
MPNGRLPITFQMPVSFQQSTKTLATASAHRLGTVPVSPYRSSEADDEHKLQEKTILLGKPKLRYKIEAIFVII